MESNEETGLSRLSDRVGPDEKRTATRPAGPAPASGDRNLAREAAARIFERRTHLKLAPMADLTATVHEAHRY